MRLAFFGYAWGPGGELDGYMQEAVKAYLGLGFDVDVYLGNYFSSQLPTSGFKSVNLLEKLVRYIRDQRYVAAVSMNNSLLIDSVVEALDGHITSVIVDGFNHLFSYTEDRFAAFRLPVQFAPIGTQLVRGILAEAPEAAARVTFLTPATAGMNANRTGVPLAYPISWVASLTADNRAEEMMRRLMSDPQAHEVVRACLMAIEERGDLAEVMSVHGELISPVVEQLGLEPKSFEMMLQDVITSRDRIEVVNRLAPHGLALFGNAAWSKAMVLSEAVFRAHRPAAPVRTHQDLLKVYNSSKISINLPQSFIFEAFQYRLLDIMSSNALLVTRRTSDLYRVFGSDCPVEMFDSADELEAICTYYLAHEEERAAKVAACNSLVTEEFSFQSRAVDYLRLAGVEYSSPTAAFAPGRARVLTDQSFA